MKLSEIEHRILGLEHALSNLQQCPADPCRVRHAVEAAATAAEPKYDVTEENWHIGGHGIFQNGVCDCVCPGPDPALYPEGIKLWPQRSVLIVHAPEMYRELVRLYHLVPGWSELDHLRKLLTIIEKELQENE